MMPKLKWIEHADLAINTRPTIGRRDFLDWMSGRGGVPLFTELFGPLVGLKEEWEEQCASAAELDLSAFAYQAPKRYGMKLDLGRLGARCDRTSEDARSIYFQDDLGRHLRMDKGYATLPLPQNYPVRTMDDWRKIKPRYQFAAARIAADAIALAQQARANDIAVSVAIPGGFDEPRQLLGEEALCLAYYDQPELIADILDTIGTMIVRVFETVLPQVAPDIIDVHEDMAGKSGSLIGPATITEFIKPYYRRVWDMAASHGAELFIQDSDGDMNGVIDAFLDCGLNCLSPAEPGAGMDIVALRARYGQRLAFCGGIDKYVLRQSPEAITRELEYKLPPMLKSRGCLLGLDHRIPNGTPLCNYRFYHAKVWEIIRRETGVK